MATAGLPTIAPDKARFWADRAGLQPKLPWNAELILCAIAAVEGDLELRLTIGRRRDLEQLLAMLRGMMTLERTESDILDLIEEYEIADSMGLDVEHLRRTGGGM